MVMKMMKPSPNLIDKIKFTGAWHCSSAHPPPGRPGLFSRTWCRWCPWQTWCCLPTRPSCPRCWCWCWRQVETDLYWPHSDCSSFYIRADTRNRVTTANNSHTFAIRTQHWPRGCRRGSQGDFLSLFFKYLAQVFGKQLSSKSEIS